jgi:hypothetical protein
MPRRQPRGRSPPRERPYTPTRGAFAGRRFRGERAYRAALRERRREIPAEADRVRRRPILTLEQANALTREQEDEWIRSLEVPTLMRKHGLSFAKAVHRVGLSEEIVLRFVGPALTTDARGRVRPKPFDRLLRIMPFWTTRGQIQLPTRDSRVASQIGKQSWAVRQFIEGKGQRGLNPFEGQSITVGRETYPFITDPLTLKRLHQRDIPEYELYSRRI